MQLGGRRGCKDWRALTKAKETNSTSGMTPVNPQTQRQLQNVASSPREPSCESSNFVTTTRPFLPSLFLPLFAPCQSRHEKNPTLHLHPFRAPLHHQRKFCMFQTQAQKWIFLWNISLHIPQSMLMVCHIHTKSLTTLNCSSGAVQRSSFPRQVAVTPCSGCRQGYSVDTHRKMNTQP